MIRLSKRGWNNVIIFAMLFLILLFNFSNNMLLDNAVNSEEQHALLPEYSEINQIDFGTHRIQRIGLGWRMQPSLAITEPELASIAQQWLQATGQIMPFADLSQAYVVSVQLAGEEQARVFKVSPQGEDVLIQYQQRLILLSQQDLSQFIPQLLQ